LNSTEGGPRGRGVPVGYLEVGYLEVSYLEVSYLEVSYLEEWQSLRGAI
jgi:hypothetical protein